jgi:hypothetical protein
MTWKCLQVSDAMAVFVVLAELRLFLNKEVQFMLRHTLSLPL